MKHFILIALLSLAACGGGDPEPQSELRMEVAKMERQRMDTRTIVRMHGDSTQRGAHTGNSPASVAQALLSAEGVNVNVINNGQGGSTTELRLYGGAIPNGVSIVQPWAPTMVEFPADIYTFKFGINDAKYYSAARFRENVNLLIDMTEATGAGVVLETPSPTDIVDKPWLQENIERNVTVLRSIASERPSVTFCNHWGYGLRFGYENQDGIHPTSYSYDTWVGPKAAACIAIAINRRAANK